ncbi:unnamed protein product [Chondrus crispus]|uniref:PDZ domain-containing protein n=1 Tax=Chondrus crispus TaxID=2769 RepID=R7QE88_CHOCR|nr:unnamed protein product [Chondrus crispus]CDF36827.1 unnamed protein product [Chondrus crispus]|eukprot:XP_005716646.1 unnamed protein product [Chondrus crispus]
MVAFVAPCFAASQNGVLSRKNTCLVRKRVSRSLCVCVLNDNSGNGVNFPPASSWRDDASDVEVRSTDKEADEEDNFEIPDPQTILREARIVSVPLPLDAYLEESASGQVFIDELVPDGNSAKTGLISEGDVIVAVSLPFGDSMIPISRTSGVKMILEHVSTRDEDEEFFQLALISSPGVEVLRAQIQELTQQEIEAHKRVREGIDKVFIDEYPEVKRVSEDENTEAFDPKFLRREGFDI